MDKFSSRLPKSANRPADAADVSSRVVKSKPLPKTPVAPPDRFETAQDDSDLIIRTPIAGSTPAKAPARNSKWVEASSEDSDFIRNPVPSSQPGSKESRSLETFLKSLSPEQANKEIKTLLSSDEFSGYLLTRRDDLDQLLNVLQNVSQFHGPSVPVSDYLLQISRAKNTQERREIKARSDQVIAMLRDETPQLQEAVRLADEGADLTGVRKEILNRRDYLGNTALHYAVQSGKQNALEVFMAAGANPNLKNHKRLTPLDLAGVKKR